MNARLSNIENLLLDIKHQPKENNSAGDQLLNIKQAAKVLDVAVPTIYGYVHKSEIPYSKGKYISTKQDSFTT